MQWEIFFPEKLACSLAQFETRIGRGGGRKAKCLLSERQLSNDLVEAFVKFFDERRNLGGIGCRSPSTMADDDLA